MLHIGILFALVTASPDVQLEKVIAHENKVHQLDLSVDMNMGKGKILLLSDGSTWLVSPESLKISASWISPSPLKVEQSNNRYYPYKITQIRTNQSVLVEKIPPYQPGSLNIQAS